MSWLNFNESLNSIKGQLSNFASGVLAEGILDEPENHVGSPKNQKEEPVDRGSAHNSEPPISAPAPPENGNSWTWEPPGEPPPPNDGDAGLVAALRKKIDELEREKKELVAGLEQLDLDCQQTTDKLVTLKDDLQTSYNELRGDFEKLQAEYGEVLAENMRKGKEIELLRSGHLNHDLAKSQEDHARLQEANEHEIARLKASYTELETKMGKDNEDIRRQLADDFLKQSGADDGLAPQYEALQVDHERLVNDHADLTRKHQQLELAHEDALEQLAKLQADASAQAELVKLQADHQKLQEEYERARASLPSHEKYLSIITENMRQYIDSEAPSMAPLPSNEQPQVVEFAGKVEALLKLLLDFKCKSEALEKELCGVSQDKAKAIAEKNFEIEKLLKNSEILSQEVITKTQSIKDYEDECAELMKNNDLLISELQNYKNSSGLQTISEGNEDNLLLLESQLENANKRIQDFELIISDLENSKQEANLETQTELDYIKKQLNLTGQELNHSKEQYQDLLVRFNEAQDEKHALKSALDKLKLEYENTEYKYTELNIGMETLTEENQDFQNKLTDLNSSGRKLETLNFSLETKIELLQDVVDDLKQKLEIQLQSSDEKDAQIRQFVERLQNSKMCETKLKLQVDTTGKELQSVSETKQILETKYNEGQSRLQELEIDLVMTKEECASLRAKASTDTSSRLAQLEAELKNERRDKAAVETQLDALKSASAQSDQRNHQLEQQIAFMQAQLTDLSSSRNELIALVTQKHQENVQYHEEIQRLTRVVETDSVASNQSQDELEDLHRKHQELTHANQELSKTIDELSQQQPSLSETNDKLTKQVEQIEKLTDQNNFLREKCEVLAQNLLQEQSNLQKALSERLSASDKEQSLAKELERLRAHLVEIEEMYTQELLTAEQKNKEMRVKVNEIEQREKDSSSIYTSVSIRANQQVETLQTQLQLVTNQRDELRGRVSDLEDDHNKQVAALTNLQLVLEQFQKEKQKDVLVETERVRRQVGVERQVQQELRGEIASLKAQLEESKQGLQAASRLSDQLEKCKRHIISLKDEVTKLQDQLKTSEASYRELATQTDTKVDKTLLKNLVIGYITSHSNDQNQILKIIATVLDFSQKESDKVDLNKPQQGWLSLILHPQSLNSGRDMTQQSLSEAFVRFLENESKPKVLPNLLISNQAKKGEGSSASTTPRLSPSPLALSDVMLPTFVDFGKSRNSSSILKDVLKDNS